MLRHNIDLPRRYRGIRDERPLSEVWGPRLLFLVFFLGFVGVLAGFQTFLTLAVTLGLAAAVIGLKHPSIGIIGIGILSALDSPTRVFLSGSILRWNTFNYWLLFVIFISLPKLLKLKHSQIRLLQFFILLLGVELIISPAISSGIQHLLGIFIFFGLLVYFGRAKSEEQNWYWFASVTGLLSALATLLFLTQKGTLPYINPNSWSYMPLTGILAINLGIPSSQLNRKRYFFLWILAALNLFFVFLSGSRGSLLVAVFGILFLVLQSQSLKRGVSMVLVATLLVIALSTQFTDFQAYSIERIDRLFDANYSLSRRTNGRNDLALGGWYIFLAHPLGIGTGGFAPVWAAMGNFNGLISGGLVGEEMQQHSAWIKVLAENGFPGFILLFSFVVSFAILGLRRTERHLRMIGLLTTAVLSLAFLATNFTGKSLWLLAAGAMVLLQDTGDVFSQKTDGYLKSFRKIPLSKGSSQNLKGPYPEKMGR